MSLVFRPDNFEYLNILYYLLGDDLFKADAIPFFKSTLHVTIDKPESQVIITKAFTFGP